VNTKHRHLPYLLGMSSSVGTGRLALITAVLAGISSSCAFTATPTHSNAHSGSVSALTATLAKECTLDGRKIRGPITPLGNFVLVRTRDTLDATEGGILLPDQSKERPTEGEVVAAGPGKLHPHTGVRITNPVTAGDSVLFGKFDGHNMNYNDEAVTMIRDDDILLHYTGVRMTMENVQPCRDYVLVELTEQKAETASGIVVAGSVMAGYEPCEGKVVKVGEGRMTSTGQFSESPVKVGDRVKFKDYAGNGVKIEGVEHSLVRMVDVLCAVEMSA
jgi:chaperonin GroES